MIDNIYYIAKGLDVTLRLYFIIILFSIPLGLLLALGDLSKISLLKKFVTFYTWIFRGTPLLLQLFFVYYGLPIMGITLSPFAAASITFIINYAAYLCEIFRGSIQGINKGQFEAAKVLGMGYKQTMIRVIFPQALRTALPPLSNEAIALLKDTSLVSIIGTAEILRKSKELVTRDFTITPFFISGVFYLILSTLILLVFKKLEKRMAISCQ
ncbi:amino acid ABC transporter permease [Psychrilyobacter sp.]|uniref:amino acid ABC transporter permease n=1 Tax=Psychrilyobacter sp. TaxID=2586924 RepID=UPI003015A837